MVESGVRCEVISCTGSMLWKSETRSCMQGELCALARLAHASPFTSTMRLDASSQKAHVWNMFLLCLRPGDNPERIARVLCHTVRTPRDPRPLCAEAGPSRPDRGDHLMRVFGFDLWTRIRCSSSDATCALDVSTRPHALSTRSCGAFVLCSSSSRCSRVARLPPQCALDETHRNWSLTRCNLSMHSLMHSSTSVRAAPLVLFTRPPRTFGSCDDLR